MSLESFGGKLVRLPGIESETTEGTAPIAYRHEIGRAPVAGMTDATSLAAELVIEGVTYRGVLYRVEDEGKEKR